MQLSKSIETTNVCYHCGEDIIQDHFKIEDKSFCCQGCQTVYEILNTNNMCKYYDMSDTPGINQKFSIRKGKFDFLADATIANQLIQYKQDHIYHVTFYLPQMHCNACIWMLENLSRFNKGLLQSKVYFTKREVQIQYDSRLIDLREVAETLSYVGYEPHISLDDQHKKNIKKYDTSKILKIGIAGFCFGNIMMFSFPEYLSNGTTELKNFSNWFNTLNLLLAIPVFFYCASEFFSSAFKSIQQKELNIDAPIALAILVTFLRSIYEILGHTGSGYLDSMSGIVFFMLIGRYFQNRIYQSISFDRDFSAYFPLGITKILDDGKEIAVSIDQLKVGDRIKLFDQEIIPADAILFRGTALIDYSFVSGESKPIDKSIGEIIYAGGKQLSGVIELEIVKAVSQSYLTQLWNSDAFTEKSKETNHISFINSISKYFTYVLLSLALASAIYWSIFDTHKMWLALTSILIVACPCALLLSATFTNGNMIRHLNNFKFYIKNDSVLERIAKIDTIVFDKTGTITQQNLNTVQFQGSNLTVEQQQLIKSLAAQSNHPYSKAIASKYAQHKNLKVNKFLNQPGLGISGLIDGKVVKLGKALFVCNPEDKTNNSDWNENTNDSHVAVAIDQEYLGYFAIKSIYRPHLIEVIEALKKEYQLKILSGDNANEAPYLKNIFGENTTLHFNQNPESKLQFIRALQSQNKKVMMIGDGLNDAGGLKQSDVGIAISDNTNNFSPACDIIMSGKSFLALSKLLQFCKKQKRIIYACFGVSLMYNVVGLYYAISAQLNPMLAAILMPASSISIVLITLTLSAYHARKISICDDNHI